MKSLNLLIATSVNLLVSCTGKVIETGREDPAKPNIIFILSDDLGYGDLSCYNPASKIRTPGIDQLASQGMLFTDAHSPSSVCTPTRYGILTGRYAWRGILKKGVIEGNFAPILEPDRQTVADFLKANGYRTAVFGKWHLGMTFQDGDGGPAPRDEQGIQSEIDFTKNVLDGPNQHGFDEAFVTPGCPSDDIFNFWVNNNKIPQELEERESGIWQKGWEHEQVDTLLANLAVSFIKDHMASTPGEPFFLYLPLSVPHGPWKPPVFVQGKTKAGPRGDQVFLADWCLSVIDSVLHDLQIDENTLLIFTSDNGPMEGVNGHDSSGPFRGQKGEIWEGGHRIPLVIRWPGRIERNSRCHEIVGLVDMFATCADLLEKEIHENMAEDSYSILPYLLGEELESPVRKDIIHHSEAGVFSLRRGNWKLILGTKEGGYHSGGPIPGSPGQLYDLARDPFETHDLWESMPEKVSELEAILLKESR